MREFNKREKAIFYFSVPVCLMLAWSIFARNFQRTLDRQIGAVEEADGRLGQLIDGIRQIPDAPKTIEAAVETPNTPAPVHNETSLILYREMTEPGELEGVTIVTTEKMSDVAYRVTVRGSFAAMVRWVTYFERPEGRFQISSARMSPISNDPSRPSNELTGNFEMKLKG